MIYQLYAGAFRSCAHTFCLQRGAAARLYHLRANSARLRLLVQIRSSLPIPFLILLLSMEMI